MRGNPDKIKGKGFDKNPQNINRNGRPPRLVNTVIAELKKKGYERVEHKSVIESMELMLNLQVEEIAKIANDKNNNIFVQTIARMLMTKSDKERFDFIETMLRRAHGMPKQLTELTGKDGEDLKINVITDKEHEKLINDL
jgi:hypothetical protein